MCVRSTCHTFSTPLAHIKDQNCAGPPETAFLYSNRIPKRYGKWAPKSVARVRGLVKGRVIQDRSRVRPCSGGFSCSEFCHLDSQSHCLCSLLSSACGLTCCREKQRLDEAKLLDKSLVFAYAQGMPCAHEISCERSAKICCENMQEISCVFTHKRYVAFAWEVLQCTRTQSYGFSCDFLWASC